MSFLGDCLQNFIEDCEFQSTFLLIYVLSKVHVLIKLETNKERVFQYQYC